MTISGHSVKTLNESMDFNNTVIGDIIFPFPRPSPTPPDCNREFSMLYKPLLPVDVIGIGKAAGALFVPVDEVMFILLTGMEELVEFREDKT